MWSYAGTVSSDGEVQEIAPDREKDKQQLVWLGDVNEDRNVNLDDVRIVLQAALQINSFTDRENRIAGAVAGEDVTLEHVRKILKCALCIDKTYQINLAE